MKKGKNMKKFFFIIIPLAIFAFLYVRVNSNTPKDLEIKNYKEGEVINCNNCTFTSSHKDLIDKEYYSILPIAYDITNNNNQSYDCSNILYNLVVYNGYGETTVQNISDFPVDLPDEQMPNPYDVEYEPKDFILASGESKQFIFYYIVNKEQLKKFPTCIKLANNLYKDTYNNKLKNGSFYYEIIDLELGFEIF